MDEERKRFAEVLNTFMDTCQNPTPRQVEAWTEAHPEYAQHIRRAAADILAINRMTGGRRGRPPSEAEVDAEFAKAAGPAGFDLPVATLADVIDDSGHDLPTIARRLDIGVDVLVGLEEGLCASEPPARFIDAFANVVAMPRRKVRGAIEASRRDAGLVLAANMETKSTAESRTWDELLAVSDMPAPRKRYWREEPGAAHG